MLNLFFWFSLQVSLRRRKESLSREASLEGVRRQVSVDPGEPTLQDKPQLPVKGYLMISIFLSHKIKSKYFEDKS